MKSKRIKDIEENISFLERDYKAIGREHDLYAFDSQTEALDWFNSFSVQDLHDLYAVERSLPTGKRSLKDLALKSKLRKMHAKKEEEIEFALYELNIAHIDHLLEKIERILNE